MKLQEKLANYAGSISGGVSVLSSWQICHNICLGVIAILSVIGITLTGMPLMFLEKISLPVWLLAVAMLGVTGIMLFKKTCMSKKLFIANTGLIIAGVPFKSLGSIIPLFWIVGGVLVAGSIGFAIRDKYYAPYAPAHYAPNTVAKQKSAKQKSSEPKNSQHKSGISWVLGGAVVLVLGIILVNTVLLYRLSPLSPTSSGTPTGNAILEEKHSHFEAMKFDHDAAHEHMDANEDGLCDSCGMPIEDCIDMGMIDCTMGDSSAGISAGIGLLKSAHIHADWKIYVNGKQIDLTPYSVPNSDPEKTSKFIHVEAGPSPEKVGDVLHIHATGVSLGLFFESVGLEFNSTCIESDKMYCNDNMNSVKFFVNGKQRSDFGKYVPESGDKILVSHGPKNEDVTEQLNSITDFVRLHYTKK